MAQIALFESNLGHFIKTIYLPTYFAQQPSLTYRKKYLGKQVEILISFTTLEHFGGDEEPYWSTL